MWTSAVYTSKIFSLQRVQHSQWKPGHTRYHGQVVNTNWKVTDPRIWKPFLLHQSHLQCKSDLLVFMIAHCLGENEFSLGTIYCKNKIGNQVSAKYLTFRYHNITWRQKHCERQGTKIARAAYERLCISGIKLFKETVNFFSGVV